MVVNYLPDAVVTAVDVSYALPKSNDLSGNSAVTDFIANLIREVTDNLGRWILYGDLASGSH